MSPASQVRNGLHAPIAPNRNRNRCTPCTSPSSPHQISRGRSRVGRGRGSGVGSEAPAVLSRWKATTTKRQKLMVKTPRKPKTSSKKTSRRQGEDKEKTRRRRRRRREAPELKRSTRTSYGSQARSDRWLSEVTSWEAIQVVPILGALNSISRDVIRMHRSCIKAKTQPQVLIIRETSSRLRLGSKRIALHVARGFEKMRKIKRSGDKHQGNWQSHDPLKLPDTRLQEGAHTG